MSRDRDPILLVSCYELGHQPLAIATLASFFERRGLTPLVVDLAVDPIAELAHLEGLDRLRLAVISVPMHTALHVGVRAARALRARAPSVHLCFFGLYATLNADHLLDDVADSVISGECEPAIVALAEALARGGDPHAVPGLWLRDRPAAAQLVRLDFPVPRRADLPAFERYARLEHAGTTRIAAAVEASRGCLHRCRHCPITPVYEGRFFVVPRDVVMQDIRGLAARGVTHLTFADPDFLNGPGHSLALVRELHRSFPGVTFDVTTKVEHVLQHRALWPELAASGCLFVVSAVESLSDVVLDHLAKGHTRDDVFRALEVLRACGIALRPSLVAFTPWTTLEDYLDVLAWIARERLEGHIDPVQLSIRLLLPPGSLLLSLEAMRRHLAGFDPASFQHAWVHPDARMDRLQTEVRRIVAEAAGNGEPPTRTFARIGAAAYAAAGRVSPQALSALAAKVALVPRLTEPWFC